MIALAAVVIPAVLMIPGDVTGQNWKAFPNAKQMQDVWPDEHSDGALLDFSIIVRCRIVSAVGRITCYTVAEDPAGYGVGRRAAEAMTKYGVIDMKRSKGARTGGVFNQVMKFTIED
jgi:hypothetical protein